MNYYNGIPNTIQYNSSELIVGEQNICEAVNTDKEIFFNESYVVSGKLTAKKIYATYNLSILGSVEAEEIIVNGTLLVNGDIKTNLLQCQKNIMCSGKLQAEELICDSDVMVLSVVANRVTIGGNLLVMRTIDVNRECKIGLNLFAQEGISGSANFIVQSAIAGDYFDVDGHVEGNIYEIATMFTKMTTEKEENNKTGGRNNLFCKKLNELLTSLENEVFTKNEEILEQISECSKIQRISFDEMKYLLEEIIRISYCDKIDNLRDYLLVQYADKVFPEQLKKYKTIEVVFSVMIQGVDVSELQYFAENLLEFMMSLRAICICYENEVNFIADRVFSFVGIKYSVVKRRFEEAML